MSNPFSSGSSFTSQALPAASNAFSRVLAAKNDRQAQQQRLAKAQIAPTIIGSQPRDAATGPYGSDKLGAGA